MLNHYAPQVVIRSRSNIGLLDPERPYFLLTNCVDPLILPRVKGDTGRGRADATSSETRTTVNQLQRPVSGYAQDLSPAGSAVRIYIMNAERLEGYAQERWPSLIAYPRWRAEHSPCFVGSRAISCLAVGYRKTYGVDSNNVRINVL